MFFVVGKYLNHPFRRQSTRKKRLPEYYKSGYTPAQAKARLHIPTILNKAQYSKLQITEKEDYKKSIRLFLSNLQYTFVDRERVLYKATQSNIFTDDELSDFQSELDKDKMTQV